MILNDFEVVLTGTVFVIIIVPPITRVVVTRKFSV